MKHDYQKVINDRYLSDDETWVKAYSKTIEHALKLAAKVTGEPSFGMTNAAMELCDGYNSEYYSAFFKAMIAQAEREIEG